MKRKSLATLLSGFLTVCLTGVGFASWLITGGDEKEVTGTVSAETVENRKTSIVLLEDHKDFDAEICFGHNPKDSNGNDVEEKWFKKDGKMKDEDLEAVIMVSIENATYSTFAVTIDEKFDTYVDKGYITYDIDFTAPETNAATEVAITITFGWGELFDEKNPYEYFNSIDNPTKEDVTKAVSMNEVFADLNSGLNLKIVATYIEE